MNSERTVAQSVRDEVVSHERTILKLQKSAEKIAKDHHCVNDNLIKLALLKISAEAQLVVQL